MCKLSGEGEGGEAAGVEGGGGDGPAEAGAADEFDVVEGAGAFVFDYGDAGEAVGHHAAEYLEVVACLEGVGAGEGDFGVGGDVADGEAEEFHLAVGDDGVGAVGVAAAAIAPCEVADLAEDGADVALAAEEEDDAGEEFALTEYGLFADAPGHFLNGVVDRDEFVGESALTEAAVHFVEADAASKLHDVPADGVVVYGGAHPAAEMFAFGGEVFARNQGVIGSDEAEHEAVFGFVGRAGEGFGEGAGAFVGGEAPQLGGCVEGVESGVESGSREGASHQGCDLFVEA